jgi:ketosteroid isomerase-like protein
MSEENAEIVRRAFEAINLGDVDAALQDAADEFVVDWSNSTGPVKGIYKGKAKARELWGTFVEAFEELTWDAEEIIDVDESRVIAVNHVRMRGRGSGVAVDAKGVQLWTIADGEAQSVKLFQNKEDALEAAGLRE